MSSYLPVFLREQFALTPVAAGTLTAAAALVGSLARPVGVYVADRIGGARVLQWLLIAITAAYALLGFAPSVTAVAPIIVGGMMDIFSSIIVVVPLIVPIAAHFQVDPIHLGIVFIANSELGYLTPPVGENLFVASYRFNKPILQLARAMLPMYVILLIGVLLITYLPWLTTGFLP